MAVFEVLTCHVLGADLPEIDPKNACKMACGTQSLAVAIEFRLRCGHEPQIHFQEP